MIELKKSHTRPLILTGNEDPAELGITKEEEEKHYEGMVEEIDLRERVSLEGSKFKELSDTFQKQAKKKAKFLHDFGRCVAPERYENEYTLP